MRLDHLLSKELLRETSKSQVEHLGLHCLVLKEQPSNGGVAQLGEHLPCKQGVRSSILLVSTI